MVKMKTSRASSPGGSRANTKSTRVQVWVRVKDLPISEIQKKQLRVKLAHHINHNDEIEAWCEETRVQAENRKLALEHLNKLVENALVVRAVRIPTEVPRNRDEERMREKRFLGARKGIRRVSRASTIPF